MIKSFKDFDNELKGQKIYEAIDDNQKQIFTSEDIKIPQLLSDNNYFLKISRIVLKKLDSCGLGEFCVHPTIVNIDGVDGVYFYNYNDSSINIVICSNTFGKQAYLFKDFTLGEKNVADLVLTTAKLGFSDIIRELINYIKPVAIEESLWIEGAGGVMNYTDDDIEDAKEMPQHVRQNIINIILKAKASGIQLKYNQFYLQIWNGYESGDEDMKEICEEIQDKCGKGKPLKKTGYIKGILMMFYNAITKQNTSHLKELEALLADCKTDVSNSNPNRSNNGNEGNNDDISVDENVNTDVTSDEIKYVRDPSLQKKIERSAEKYVSDLEDLIDFVTSMCRYVKKHGELTDDERSVFRRGLIITGPGGAGKSKHINDIMAKEGMTKNVDYFELGSGSTSAQNLYRLLYDFNGKLLILDDSADMFGGKYNLPLWKLALDPDPRNNYISYNRSTTGGNFYDPYKKGKDGQVPTRQQKYFLEVGSSSIEEKTKFIAKMEKELWAKLDTHAMDPDELTSAQYRVKKEADDAWMEQEENKEPLIPTTFKYNGVVIIICNDDRKTLIDSITPKHWGAIKDRFNNVDFDPMPQAIWETIKVKLLEQRDMDPAILPDKQCLIPRQYVDEVIEEVESIIDLKRYNRMTWRIITEHLHYAFQGPTGIKKWKKTLRTQMDITI
jgi:hypothetical protein